MCRFVSLNRLVNDGNVVLLNINYKINILYIILIFNYYKTNIMNL